VADEKNTKRPKRSGKDVPAPWAMKLPEQRYWKKEIACRSVGPLQNQGIFEATRGMLPEADKLLLTVWKGPMQ